jgi:hypothetical protein
MSWSNKLVTLFKAPEGDPPPSGETPNVKLYHEIDEKKSELVELDRPKEFRQDKLPTQYSHEVFEELIKLVIDGHTAKSACYVLGISYYHYANWVHKYKNLKEEVAMAREINRALAVSEVYSEGFVGREMPVYYNGEKIGTTLVKSFNDRKLYIETVLGMKKGGNLNIINSNTQNNMKTIPMKELTDDDLAKISDKGDFARNMVEQIKSMQTIRQLTKPTSLGSNIIDAEIIEENN